jgi:competence protein ComEA
MLRKILSLIQDFFGISPKESRGALVLILLSGGLLLLPSVFKWGILPYFQDDSPPFTLHYLDSTAAHLPEASVPGANDSPYNPQNRHENARPPSRLFVFDPNTATPGQLEELGVPRFLALRIEKYRQKGGTFRKKEDLKKIYDFPTALYNRLEPYISVPHSAENDPTKTTVASSDAGGPPLPREVRAYGRSVLAPFDINTSDTAQLARLRGIGEKLSTRIVKFRDALGGFHSTDQYREIFGLDSVALTEMQQYARIQTPPKKIPINTVSAEDLYKHPYFRNKKLNEVIIRYREQHGDFASPESLRGIRILDEATLRKISPYLSF